MELNNSAWESTVAEAQAGAANGTAGAGAGGAAASGTAGAGGGAASGTAGAGAGAGGPAARDLLAPIGAAFCTRATVAELVAVDALAADDRCQGGAEAGGLGRLLSRCILVPLLKH